MGQHPRLNFQQPISKDTRSHTSIAADCKDEETERTRPPNRGGRTGFKIRQALTCRSLDVSSQQTASS